MNQTTLCQAIKNRNLIQFYYQLGTNPGYRTVEPQMIAYNKADHVCLSAWFLSGTSESKEGPGWREYLLSGISSVSILPHTFSRPCPGYDPKGGKRYHKVQCCF